MDPAVKALLAELTPSPISAAPGQNMLPPAARRDAGGTPVWRAHAGAATLFVHGWNDTHRIWRQYAQDFISNSRPILLMDLPGHGASKAADFSAEAAGQAVLGVCEAEAPIDTIIAHSFGCIAAARAVASGAEADYMILIAPPVLGWAETKRREGADPGVLDAALAVLAAEGRSDLAPFDFTRALAGYSGKLLFIGSEADISCPLDAISAVAASLPGAEVHGAAHLGHRELCLDRDVLAKMLAFLGYG